MTDPRDQLQSSLGSAYTLERELGGGGMSRTYLATEHALSRRVVVKILAPELLAGISVERFKREVLLAAQLQHPHVVPVLASGDADGLPWFTMPYVEGESLRTRLGRGPLRIGEITGILRDVARALEFAHDHGVVHRDIKPDNVLLAGSSATVTDFGIAKAITAARTGASGSTLTMAGTTLGTPAYMPPEQAAGDPLLDHRSDIYSFGAMAYELLSGRPPFTGASAAKIVSAHFSEAPRPISELRADTPPILAALVMRCLEKEPNNRPQSASDVVRVLETVTSSGATDAAPAILFGSHIRLARALALWAGCAALVALTAWAATSVIGLPDWVFPGSLGVMLAGLPVILFTSFVQRTAQRTYTTTPAYTPGGSPSGQGTFASIVAKASPHVSWRRTWIGGAIALGTFAALVIGFMVFRALGIGPAGSLMAAGKLGTQETLIVADFRGPAGDSTLGPTVAEALRTDLRQSSTLNVMTRASVSEVLTFMKRPPDTPVDFNTAREIATREGARAVLDGAVVKLGDSYVVSARLVSALDGAELANFSETAKSENDLIRSLGKLSRAIRSRIGESLKDIREAKPLERVTTPSLLALRKYVEAVRLSDEMGDVDRGLTLLNEAVTLDTAFAMAWRKIATLLGNMRTDRARQLDAATRAFRHRERLSDTERLLTEAYYYDNGPEPSRERAAAAYESLIELDPNNTTALNNLGVGYMETRQYAKAADRLRRSLVDKRPFGGSFTNLMQAQTALGQPPAAIESTLVQFRTQAPGYEGLWEGEVYLRWARGELAAADSIARATAEHSPQVFERTAAAFAAGGLAHMRGKLRDALRWKTESHLTVYRASHAPERLLVAAFDSAQIVGFFLEQPQQARTIVRRALARTPMTQVPAPDRPWVYLGEIGAMIRDVSLAREALDGFEKDLPLRGSRSPDGDRARMRAWVAMASGDYLGAIRELHEADRTMVISERRASVAIADAFDLAGQPDSAIAYYEQFVRTQDPFPLFNTHFLAGTHKRLGELYDARADTGRAEAHYQFFLELWKDADAELQPKVREVRARIAQLRQRKG
jgi:tetratricopeptide (TPR) repeat protein/tRNA A-37 threonylcarbamoyl transferase component Bud32